MICYVLRVERAAGMLLELHSKMKVLPMVATCMAQIRLFILPLLVEALLVC
jgi:hypothetical protein